MDDKEKNQIPFWAKIGHSRPVTRREMLATGMIGFAGGIMAPNLLRLLLPEEVQAQSISLPPFIHIHLSGGAGLASNTPPKDKGGNFLANNDLIGLGQEPLTNVVAPPFIGPQFYGGSGVLAGIKSVVDSYDSSVYAGVRMCTICSVSRDDNSEDRFDISGSLNKLGLRGTILPSLGTDNTITGNATLPALDIPPPILPVSSFSSIQNALTYSGQVAGLSANHKAAIARLVKRLSASQTVRLLTQSTGATVKSLFDAASLANLNNMSGTGTQIDPRVNVDVQKIFNQTTATNDNNTRFAGMAWAVLNGYSSMAKMTLGGYDYHDGTRTSGDARDNDAGQLIGRLLSLAKALKKPLYLFVTTDGAVSSDRTLKAQDAVWRSDRGIASLAYMFTYSPANAPSMKTSQLGWFTAGQATDASFVSSATAELTAATAYANYLYFSDPKTAEKNFHDTARGALPDLEIPKVNVFNV